MNDKIISSEKFDQNLNECYLAGYAAGSNEKNNNPRSFDDIREEMLSHDAELRELVDKGKV
jgi:hypothetical protein